MKWPPDWRGWPVVIIGSGASAKSTDVSAVRGSAKVIAIKQGIELCPWTDMVYGCDKPWWDFRHGLQQFKGYKVAWGGSPLDWPDIHKVEIVKVGREYSQRIEMGKVGTIGGGGNSGFQAMNLAIQFGARRILLVGFDMTDQGGLHWYGRNNWPMANNPARDSFERWISAFNAAVPTLREIGVEVFNASAYSALTCFPKVTVADFLKGVK